MLNCDNHDFTRRYGFLFKLMKCLPFTQVRIVLEDKDVIHGINEHIDEKRKIGKSELVSILENVYGNITHENKASHNRNVLRRAIKRLKEDIETESIKEGGIQ